MKSELNIERKINERIKYNKKVNENNTEKIKKEKEILLLENDSLKDTIDDLTDKLRKESKKNCFNDEQKNEYENLLDKMKNEIDFLNENNELLKKENSELKLNHNIKFNINEINELKNKL